MATSQLDPQSPPPTPANLVLHTVHALWDNLPTLLLGGLILCLISAPAFVLFVLGWFMPALIACAFFCAPAWCALLAMQAALLDGKAATIMDMLRAFPQYWRPGVRLSVVAILPSYLLYSVLPALTEPVVFWGAWIGFAGGLPALGLALCLYLYAFPLVVLHGLSPWLALRNSAILASRFAGNTVGLLGMGILFALASLYISLGLLFILPTVYSLFVINHCRMAVDQSQDQK